MSESQEQSPASQSPVPAAESQAIHPGAFQIQQQQQQQQQSAEETSGAASYYTHDPQMDPQQVPQQQQQQPLHSVHLERTFSNNSSPTAPTADMVNLNDTGLELRNDEYSSLEQQQLGQLNSLIMPPDDSLPLNDFAMDYSTSTPDYLVNLNDETKDQQLQQLIRGTTRDDTDLIDTQLNLQLDESNRTEVERKVLAELDHNRHQKHEQMSECRPKYDLDYSELGNRDKERRTLVEYIIDAGVSETGNWC